MRGAPQRSQHASKSPLIEAEEVAPGMLLSEIPPPPETLDEIGIFWWNYYCGLFIEARILSRMYISAVSSLCHLIQYISAIEIKLKEQGTFILVPKKFQGEEYADEVLNPLIKDLQLLYAQLDKLGNSMGLTPYSSKVNSIDTSGESAASAAPTPPPVPATLKITG